MNLLNAIHGRWVRITRLEPGRGLEHKLRQLGLSPGDLVRVVRQAPLDGPVLVEIQDGRSLALGRKIAAKIFVEET